MNVSMAKDVIKMTGPAITLQEILYGFIMALIMTYAALFGIIEFSSIADYAIAVIGMVLTWGVIDGIILYLLNVADQRRVIHEIFEYDAPHEEKLELLMDELSGTPIDYLDDDERVKVCEAILSKPKVDEQKIREEKKGFLGVSIGCVIITIGVLIPIMLPLLFIDDLMLALRTVSFISSVLLFFVGYFIGPYLGVNKFLCGICIGGITLTIAFISVFTGG